MKRHSALIQNAVLTVILAVCFASCTIETASDDNPEADTRGFMEVEVTENLGIAADRMKTVRFFVFKDMQGIPKLELNRKFDIPTSGGGQEASKFKIVLETTMRPGSSSNNKMIVAVVNEPQSMATELDAISDYNSLENTKLDLSLFLNDNQTDLKVGMTMPMTGVVWTNKVYPTLNGAEADPESMKVRRAAARVDVYVRQEAGLELTLAEGSTFSLSKSYGSEYLVGQTTGAQTFGKIQTVASGFKTNSVTLSAADGLVLPELAPNQKGRLIASFYTAERTCTAAQNADKLEVGINIITNEGASRAGTRIVDRLNLEGVETDVLKVARNNIYEIIATVGTNDITTVVNDWNDENLVSEL